LTPGMIMPPQGCANLWYLAHLKAANLISRMSASGQNRKSSVDLGMSVVGGKAEVDFGRLEVCL
ncbi:MAG: hypothetical protein V3S67_01560, partial [Gammaproteobacteria bacterium]